MATYGPIYGLYDPVLPRMVPCGPIWPRIAPYGPVWPCIAKYGPVQGCKNIFSLVSKVFPKEFVLRNAQLFISKNEKKKVNIE